VNPVASHGIGSELPKVSLHDKLVRRVADRLTIECDEFAAARGFPKLADDLILMLVLEVLLDGLQDLLVCRPRIADDAPNVIGSIDFSPTGYGILAQTAKDRVLLLIDGDVDV